MSLPVLGVCVCVGQVIEGPCANGKAVEMEPKAPIYVEDSTAPLSRDTSESFNSQKTSLQSSDNTRTMMNHEDTLEVPRI